MADDHIAAAETLISRQTSLLAELERDGHNAETARSLFDTMRKSLKHMYTHREIIEAEPEA